MFKKKKKQRLCCSGKKCNFCVQIVSNFLWGQDPKTKSKKIKKKGVETILFLVQKTISEDIEN